MVGRITHDLPPNYHADRINGMIAKPGGVFAGASTGRFKPTSQATPVGTSQVRGPNSPSSLNNKFGG